MIKYNKAQYQMFPLLKIYFQFNLQIYLMNNKQDFKPSKEESLLPDFHHKQPNFESYLLRTPQKIQQRQPQTAQKSEKKATLLKVDPIALNFSPKQTKNQFSCNCRKSKCLKMYCVCFSDGKMCNNGCLCDSCLNKSDNQSRSSAINEIITRDPFAFSRGFNTNHSNVGEGCNCKRSNCTKKYCECFRKGMRCGKDCFCVDCENSKDEKLETIKKVKIQ